MDEARKLTLEEATERRERKERKKKGRTIVVLTEFGHCFQYKSPPSNATAGDVKQWLTADSHLLAQHKDLIKLIHSRSRDGLADGAIIKYSKGLCTLFAAFGIDDNLTGTKEDADIYKPTLRNKFRSPEAPASAVASAAGLSDSDSNASDDEKIEVPIPSWFEVTGMYTYEEGYHQVDNLTTLFVHDGSQVFYFQKLLITPELLQSIREVKDGGDKLANLLRCMKIGQSETVNGGFNKFRNKQTFCCVARQHFVMFIYQANSWDIETLLHARFALKQGDAYSETYADITDLNFFEMIEHFKHYPGMTILFGMTKEQRLLEYNNEQPGEGYVYRAGPTWSPQQLSVVNAVQSNYPNATTSIPFLHTMISCNTNDFWNRFHAKKFGMTQRSSVEEVGKYLAQGLLWANGIVPSGSFSCIQCDDAGEVEKTLHHNLRPFHIVGEWFKENATSTLTEFDSLFNGESHMFSRSRDHFWLSKNALRRSIDVYGIMTHRLVWEHIKCGSMIYYADGILPLMCSSTDLHETASELLPLIDPSDSYPLRYSEILAFIKTNMAANDYESMDDTVVRRRIENALAHVKCVKVRLGNRTSFHGIGNDAAMDAFVAIFGEDKRRIAESFIGR